MNKRSFLWSSLSLLTLGFPPAGAWSAALSPEQNQSVGRLTEEALQAYSDGQFDKAFQNFQSVLKIDPKDPVAQKGIRQSKSRLRSRKPFNPKIDQPTAKSVRRSVRKQDWMSAIEDVQWMLSRGPLDAGALQLQNEIAAALKKREFEAGEGTADQLSAQGFSAYLNRHYGDAAASWKKVLELSGDNPKLAGYASKAEALHQEQVVADTLLTERSRAKAALNAGNEEEAVKAWKKILEVKPDDASAQDGLAKAQDNLHRKNRSQLVALYSDEGVAFFKEGKYVASLKNWEAVVEIDPENAKAKDYIHRIRAKGTLKKPTPLEAWKASLSKPVPVPKAAAPVPVPVAPADSEDGTPAVAAPVESAAPVSSDPKYGKAEALYRSGDSEGALAAFKKILENDPKDTKASEWVDRILAERTEKADEHYNQGLLDYAQGDKKQAIKEWKAALEIDPEHAGSKRALERAERSKN